MSEPEFLVIHASPPRDARHTATIARMQEVRDKPRGVSRSDLVDRETRLFNDRRWAEWDRQDRIMAAQPQPAPRGWLRRLFGF